MLKYPLLVWNKPRHKKWIFKSLHHFNWRNSSYLYKLLLKNTLIVNICTTIFIVILNRRNNLVWLMMSSTFFLFFLQVLEKLNLDVLDFRVFSELAILEWFSTGRFKYFLYCHVDLDSSLSA